MITVSACLLTFRREQNLFKIVEHLRQFPWIGEILVRDQSRSQNLLLAGRYRLIQRATYETVYVQDDDCLVHNLQTLYDAYSASPSALVHGLRPEHLARDKEENTIGPMHMALVGWGAFFRKEWISVLDRYTRRWGEDPIYQREADRIFTMLLPRPHITMGATLTHLDGAESAEALWRQPGHLESRATAIARCRMLGGPARTLITAR